MPTHTHSKQYWIAASFRRFCNILLAGISIIVDQVVLKDMSKRHFKEIDKTDFGVIYDTCVKPHVCRLQSLKDKTCLE